MRTSERTLDLNNSYIRFLGNMSAQDVDIDIVRRGGEQLQAKIDNIVEEAASKGNDDIRIIPDLLDIKTLADRNRFTDDMKEIIGMAVALSDSAAAIAKLGFNNPTSYAEFNVASVQIQRINKQVAFQLYHNLIDCVKNNTGVDDLIDDIIFDALKDQITERMPFEVFAEERGVAIPEEEAQASKIEAAYSGSYNEWVESEAERILEILINDPMSNVLIRPMGLQDLKDVLIDVCPEEAYEWCNSITADDIYKGEIFEKLVVEFKLGQAQLKRFASAVDKFMQENQTSQKVTVGQGQEVNPFYSVNIASVILHAMIIASTELWEPEEELSEYTEYILDIYREKLLDITNIEYDDTTPYKLLSTVASVNALVISRSAYTRACSMDYIRAQGAITMMINYELMEATHKEQESTTIEMEGDK